MDEVRTPGRSPFTKKKLIVLIAAAAALALIVCVVLLIASARSPKAVAERFIAAYLKGDLAGREKLCAYDWREWIVDRNAGGGEDDFFENMSDTYDEDIASWKDYFKVFADAAEEKLSDQYGKYKIRIEATRVRDLSARKIENDYERVLEQYEDFGLDPDRISKGAEVTVKAKIDGEDDSVKHVYKVTLVKIGLSWKFLFMSIDE